MNNVKETTLLDRIRNAIRAFKGQPIGSVTFGVDIKRCSECKYRYPRDFIPLVDYGCDKCRGVKYTTNPFIVYTQMGVRVESVFKYCPECGRDLRK